MIDLHSHVLPALDDGARDLTQALYALRLLAADGITDLVCTPHLRASDVERGGEEAISRRDAVLAELRPMAPPLPVLHAGFEILLDQPPIPEMVGDRRYALAGSRYYLVEFRLSVVAQLATRILEDMAQAGVIPLVAHVERYGACSPRVVADWKSTGARIQVDATTLTRPSGRGRLARTLLEAGLVDVLAADNHGDERTLRRAVEFVRAKVADGPGPVEGPLGQLTQGNPACVLADGIMTDVAGVRLDEGLMGRVRRMLGR